MKNKKHIGSNFESFLTQENILEEVHIAAMKAITTRILKKYMNQKSKPATRKSSKK